MIKIPKVTPEMLAALPAKLATSHEAVMASGNSGSITSGGQKATFSYSPATQELSVTVIHHSFFHTESGAEKSIAENIANAIAGAAPAAATPAAAVK